MRIPAGEFSLAAPPGQIEISDLRLSAYLNAIDPDRSHAHDLDPFPVDHLQEAIL